MSPQHPRRHGGLPLSLLYLCGLILSSLASPVSQIEAPSNSTTKNNINNDQWILFNDTNVDPESRSSSSGIMMTWIWSMVWGDDSTVSVVDRTPALTFSARPAAFGPAENVLGYMIRVEDFSVRCDDDDEGGKKKRKHRVDFPDEIEWPGAGSEGWEAGSTMEETGDLEPRHGCPKLCMKDKHKPEVTETWIALVMRGGCTFVDKVREAQRFGAKGVVVGGETREQDMHGDGLVQMYSIGDASDITIPSVYITHSSYDKLSTLIANSNTSTWGLRTVSVGITIDPSTWEWYSPILTFLILLFLPSMLTLSTLLIHRLRAARAARRERAPEDVVHNLPWRVWEGQQTVVELEKLLDKPKLEPDHQAEQDQDQNQNQSLEEGAAGSSEPSSSRTDSEGVISAEGPLTAEESHWYDTQGECAICLEDFVKGDEVRVLPCRHIFHKEEVDDWLIQRKKLCPICKHDVTLPLGARSPSDDPEVGQENADSRPTPSERTPLLLPSSHS
ncbi:hypothetical protein M422DRAFT_24845 [Sphaerobolus stellatus SS14]|nr:hypothetical protein M422DRAFT_24845 [Sphaerobolus stellatus SS14]